MSSYELLELLEFMPEKGAFKSAARGGEYSEEEIVWRHIASEIARLRATTQAVHGGERYAPRVFLTVAEAKEQRQEAEEMEEMRESVYSIADRTPMAIEA
jgi:hypothetical protein